MANRVKKLEQVFYFFSCTFKHNFYSRTDQSCPTSGIFIAEHLHECLMSILLLPTTKIQSILVLSSEVSDCLTLKQTPTSRLMNPNITVQHFVSHQIVLIVLLYSVPRPFKNAASTAEHHIPMVLLPMLYLSKTDSLLLLEYPWMLPWHCTSACWLLSYPLVFAMVVGIQSSFYKNEMDSQLVRVITNCDASVYQVIQGALYTYPIFYFY